MDLNSTNGITLNQQTREFLLETAKWAKFLSIMGFIMVGFMVIGGLSFGAIIGVISEINPESTSSMGMMPTGFIGVIYVIMALIYFFPIWYLFKFSTKLKLAIQTENEAELTHAFSNLKSHYKFVGIVTIVILSLYLLMFLLSGIMFAAFQ